MERTASFGRIVTAVSCAAIVTCASAARAESCFVDLEEETADLDRVFALHVGRDDGGVVMCFGPMEGEEGSEEPPRVVARVAPDGPCVTEAGESQSRSDVGFTEIVVSVSGHNTALLRARAGLVCDDREGMSPFVEAGQTTLFEYTDVLTIDEGMPVEVYNTEDGGYMTLGMEENVSDDGELGIDSFSTCTMEDDDYYGAYGYRVYMDIAYIHYLVVCETSKDAVECTLDAPEDEGDYVTINSGNEGSTVYSPSSTIACTDYTDVGPWPYVWDGHMVLDGGTDNDWLYGADGDDTIDGSFGNDHLYGNGGDDSIVGGWGLDSIFGHDGDDTLCTNSCSSAGSTYDEYANGGNDNDTIEGGGGDDRLYGYDGNDSIEGWEGNDRIYGGSGDDEIYGLGGDDTLDGDEGGDICKGGDGTVTCIECEKEEGCD